MIFRAPNFFENFKCLGGECKKSCCIGWELEIDPDTFDYYNSLPGPFGDRLRSELKCNSYNLISDDKTIAEGINSHSFTTTVNGRCPFLNDKNLCDIVLELGEEALCDICSNYPRYTFSFGEQVEKSLTISCEEAARLLFDETGGIIFAEGIYEDNPLDDLPDNMTEDEDECITGEADEYPDSDVDEYPGGDQIYYNEPTEDEISAFLKKRQADFDIVQNRSQDFAKRLLALCKVSDLSEKYPELGSKEERLRILTLLEPIDDEWVDILSELHTGIQEKKEPDDSVWEDTAYENLLVYFLFRYLPRSLFDGDYEGKVRFALFCIHCIRDIAEILGDTRLAASTFSREVEHSEENIFAIMEEFMF